MILVRQIRGRKDSIRKSTPSQLHKAALSLMPLRSSAICSTAVVFADPLQRPAHLQDLYNRLSLPFMQGGVIATAEAAARELWHFCRDSKSFASLAAHHPGMLGLFRKILQQCPVDIEFATLKGNICSVLVEMTGSDGDRNVAVDQVMISGITGDLVAVLRQKEACCEGALQVVFNLAEIPEYRMSLVRQEGMGHAM